MKIRLHNLIFVGMILGLVIGLFLHEADEPVRPGWIAGTLWTLDLLGPVIFMGALKMIIGPLILASIVAGVTSLPNIAELGAIGWKTLVYYGVTTSIAVAIGLVFVLVIRPGEQPASRQIRETRAAELEQWRGEFEARSGRSAESAPRGYLGYVAQQ